MKLVVSPGEIQVSVQASLNVHEQGKSFITPLNELDIEIPTV